MSDIIKWAFLGIIIATVLIFVLSLPIFLGFNIPYLQTAISEIAGIAGNFILFGRNLINNFVYDGYRPLLDGVITYILIKPFLTWVINLTVMVARFIYK